MSVFSKVTDYNFLLSAYQKVKNNSNAAGVDNITPAAFGNGLKNRIKEISWALKSGVYRFGDVRLVEIRKNDKIREIGILPCTDRVVLTAVSNAITPIIDAVLPEQCYSFRPCKSALEAVGDVSAIAGRYGYFLKTDIKSFFDSIDRDLLLSKIAEIIEEEDVIDIIKSMFSAKTVMEDRQVEI